MTTQDSGASLLRRLEGDWRIHRRVDSQAELRGVASFRRRSDGAYDYAEIGHLRLADGPVLQAWRRDIFEATDLGFRVRFAEPPHDLFHDVRLRPFGRAVWGEGVHRCGDDLYCTRYRFTLDGSFTIRHGVEGPRKAWRIVTAYRRQPPEAVTSRVGCSSA